MNARELTGVALLAILLVPAASGRSPAQDRPLSRAEIRRYAPAVELHPWDRYRPMDPMDFIRSARFRHHESWGRDQGYNTRMRRWYTTNSHDRAYYDVPVRVINRYRLHRNGENRRPRDGNRGRSWNVFLQPRGKPRGVRYPNRRVPVFYHATRFGRLHKVQYWWFFGYNQSPVPYIAHQGDWEHVTVYVMSGRILGVWYAAHNGGRYHPRSRIRFAGTHPIVYCAWGTHASYPTAGLQEYPLGLRLSFVDHTARGYRWRTWYRLRRLARQPWRDFAGAWGEVGNLATTTGPLGPWHKRRGR